MALTITLRGGWNNIGWPATAPAMTNEAFLERLDLDGFSPTEIGRFDGAWDIHPYKGTFEVWQMEAGRGYQVRVLKAGVYTFPGSPVGQQCPTGQVWDVASQTCKQAIIEIIDPFQQISPLVNWMKANPVITGVGILGSILIISGGLKVRI